MPQLFTSAAMQSATKSITFTGAAGLGESDAPSTVALFTVTGEVLIVAGPTGRCGLTLVSAGGGSIACGVVGATSLFIPATLATDIATNDLWIDATPTDTNGVALPSTLKDILITDNIQLLVSTADITGGTLNFTLWWMPWSSDGNVAAA